MYKIDLLKGQGVPIKHRRGGVVMIVATFAVPGLLFAAAYTQYVVNRVNISRIEARVTDRQNQIDRLRQAVVQRKQLEKQEGVMNDSIDEIAKQVVKHEQWSEVLKALVQNLPDSLMMSRIEVKQSSTTKMVPDPVDPNKTKTAAFASRTMLVSLLGNSRFNNIGLVRDYIHAVGETEPVASRISDIRISGQDNEKIGNNEWTRYDIDCVFKPVAE
jgi:hypothetical protein